MGRRFTQGSGVHPSNSKRAAAAAAALFQWGGEYGAYQFEEMATGAGSTTTICFTLSTWNPYAVVLMKATPALGRATSALGLRRVVGLGAQMGPSFLSPKPGNFPPALCVTLLRVRWREGGTRDGPHTSCLSG